MKTLFFVRNAMYFLAALSGAIGCVTILIFLASSAAAGSRDSPLAAIGFFLGMFSAVGPFLTALFFLAIAGVMQGFLVVREGLDNLMQVGFQQPGLMMPPQPRPLPPEEQAAIAHRERLAAYDAELAARRAAKQTGQI